MGEFARQLQGQASWGDSMPCCSILIGAFMMHPLHSVSLYFSSHPLANQFSVHPLTGCRNSELTSCDSNFSPNKHMLVVTGLRDPLMAESKHVAITFRAASANTWSIFSQYISILWTTEAFGKVVQTHSMPWILHTECLRTNCTGIMLALLGNLVCSISNLTDSAFYKMPG